MAKRRGSNPIAQLLEQIKTLDRDELRQVAQAVQERIREDEPARRQAFHTALVASGLVRQIKTGPFAAPAKRRLIDVQGDPVSKTLIEERR